MSIDDRLDWRLNSRLVGYVTRASKFPQKELERRTEFLSKSIVTFHIE